MLRKYRPLIVCGVIIAIGIGLAFLDSNREEAVRKAAIVNIITVFSFIGLFVGLHLYLNRKRP